MSRSLRHSLIFSTLLLVIVAGAIFALRWYNDPVRSAQRSLNTRGVAADSASAVRAAEQNSLAVLQELRTVGVELQQPAKNGVTPLIAAVRERSLAAVDLLLKEQKVVEQIDQREPEKGRNALAEALQARNYELARVLIKNGASPDIELTGGVPLLLESLLTGDDALFDFLLEQGSGPDAVSSDGQTALGYALERQDGSLLADLLEAGADGSLKSANGEPLLIEQVRTGNHDTVAALLEAGVDPDTATDSGATALMAAIQLYDKPMVDLLLDNGAGVSTADKNGNSPLNLAIETRNRALAERLIDADAEVDSDELVMQAYQTKQFELLSKLLEAGAPAEAKNENDVRLLELALEDGNMKVADAALEHGASSKGMLWPSLRSGKEELLELILRHGGNIREKSPEGEEPINFALHNNRAAAAAVLLSHGAEANVDHPDGGTWLARMIVEGKGEMAKALLDHGACFEDQRAADGHSLLAWAVATGQSDVAVRLIEEGIDVITPEPTPASEAFREQFGSKTFRYYLRDDKGINPLMIAAAKKDHQAARAMVRAGAKPSVYTKRKTLWPVNIAAWFGDVEMMRIMLGKLQPDGRKIVVDLSSQRATLYEDGVEKFSTKVSTGKKGHDTPPGRYAVTNKHKAWTSTIYDSSMPFFLRLSCGSFGLHQGYVPSYPASHGCIRVPAGNAKSMFNLAELGDEVVIQR